jgi:hypothetical protein
MEIRRERKKAYFLGSNLETPTQDFPPKSKWTKKKKPHLIS